MISFVLNGDSNTPFYDTNIFGVIIGFLGSVVIMLLTQLLIYFRDKKKDKKHLILLITQSNSALFYQIFQGSIGNVDYEKIREELQNSNITYLFAGKLREEFVALHKIHFTNSDYYWENQKFIKKHLNNIIKEIESYGDDILEHK